MKFINYIKAEIVYIKFLFKSKLLLYLVFFKVRSRLFICSLHRTCSVLFNNTLNRFFTICVLLTQSIGYTLKSDRDEYNVFRPLLLVEFIHGVYYKWNIFEIIKRKNRQHCIAPLFFVKFCGLL